MIPRVSRAWIVLTIGVGASCVALIYILSTAFIRSASAQEVGGIYAERSTSAGGIEVRRIRDTDEGVVCYVAKGPPIGGTGAATRAFSVGISCLRELR